MNETGVNAIHCELPILAHIQNELIVSFPGTTFCYAKSFVTDIFNRDEQKDIVSAEHSRAHRAAQVNVQAILRDYYFPKIGKLGKETASNCRICKESKYERHPVKQQLGKTPIPSAPGVRLHIDIFSTDRKYFLTCVDKFSKFAIAIPIQSRNTLDVSAAMLQIINYFPNVRFIYSDNEGSFNSHSLQDFFLRYDIELSNCPPLHSTSNGQVERFHSTLIEISRCLKRERNVIDTENLVLQAVIEYNRTIHTVTKEKPCEVVQSTSVELWDRIKNALSKVQNAQNARINENRSNRIFNVGDKVMVKRNKRLGNKFCPLYVQGRIQADLGTTVLIGGNIVHKDNIR